VKLMPPPGPERRRQLVLLGVLVVALIVLAWQYWPAAGPAVSPVTASNPQSAPGTRPGSTPVAAGSQLPEALKLAELEPVPEEPAAGRNPFRFGVRPPPPPPPPPPPTKTAPPPPPPPPGPPPIPPIRLELIGLTDMPDGRRLATLKDPAGAVFQAYEGQVVDGRYRLLKVALQSAVIAYLDGQGQRTLALR
jgi:hypothetical protein